MFLAAAIALVGIAALAVFFGVRQLGSAPVEPAAPEAQARVSSAPPTYATLAEEIEALKTAMHRKAPRPIKAAIVMIILQDVVVAFVTYLIIVTFVPPVSLSMWLLFYAVLPLFWAFGLWEGRRWAWRAVMVTYGGTIFALPLLAETAVTELMTADEPVYIAVGLALQLSVIIPLWMPTARAWCRPTA